MRRGTKLFLIGLALALGITIPTSEAFAKKKKRARVPASSTLVQLPPLPNRGEGYIEYAKGQGAPYKSESLNLTYSRTQPSWDLTTLGFTLERQSRTFGDGTRVDDDRLSIFSSLDYLGTPNTVLTLSFTPTPHFLDKASIRLDHMFKLGGPLALRASYMFRDYEGSEASDVHIVGLGADYYWGQFLFQQDFVYARNLKGLGAISSLTKAIYSFNDNWQGRAFVATGEDLVDSTYTEKFTALGAMLSYKWIAIGITDHHGTFRKETQMMLQLKWSTP